MSRRFCETWEFRPKRSRKGKDFPEPGSGERMQPTACPEPAEGAQAVSMSN
jgi:hypothetical protein